MCDEGVADAMHSDERIQADWAEEQAARTDRFQRELQNKSEVMGDLIAEKVSTVPQLPTAPVMVHVYMAELSLN